MLKRRLTPLLNRALPSTRRRLVALAVFGVGIPLFFLAGLGIFQTSHIARFLRETTLEYGEYAALLVSNALQNEVERRANDAAATARQAAGWGGASPQFLALLQTDDALLKDPFLTPVETVRSRLEGVMIENAPGVWDVLDAPGGGAPTHPGRGMEGPGGALGVLPEGAVLGGRERHREVPGPSDSTLVSVPVARAGRTGLDDRVQFPAWFWRRLITTSSDTMVVLPPGAVGPGSSAYVAFPVIGFPGRVVAVAGWRFDPEGFKHKHLHEIVEREVYRDSRVFRGDVMGKSLAILLYDPAGVEVFRSREVGSSSTRIVREVGGLLPGWRVVATPSKDNAYVTIQRFISGEYGLVLVLLVLSLVALSLGLRLAMREVEIAELKSGFLANVTHELKTPLAMIRMASETLELGRVRNEDDSKRFLATISRECRRLTHMINNVLDFAKIEEGKREFFFSPTDIGRLVADTLELFEPQLKQGGFTVDVDVPEGLPRATVDAQAITQCLINLVDNAIKYSRDLRQIAIKASANGDGRVRVAVSDRGIGVAARDSERIFEKFTRADTGLVHNVKGSGLGLALVRHIARAHGGDVELASVAGEGSTFTLVLPLQQAGRKEENGWQRES
ncbi:MAG: HAMP domain-containing sensor histidine kinase [Candidatus Eisenbacteria bacterium]